MSSDSESALRQIKEELQALYDVSAEGIIIADLQGEHFLHVNQSICRMFGYTEEEMLSLSVKDIHPADSLPHVWEAFKAMGRRRLKCARDIPCLRKDGALIYADITAAHITFQDRPCMLGFFHDITERKRTIELHSASERRYRLIADNVADVIWTVDFPAGVSKGDLHDANIPAMVDAILSEWRFSYVSPAVERVLGYSVAESTKLSIRDIATPETMVQVRQALLEELSQDVFVPADVFRQHFLELELLAKDGSARWCEVLATYLRTPSGAPLGLLGILRDVTERRRAERALRESEATLRGLFENLPDLVMMLDRNADIQFINRAQSGISREGHIGECAFSFATPEHREACRLAFERALATGQPQSSESRDVFGNWWSSRVAPIVGENGIENIIVIGTDVTQERLASEAVKKEQRLLRRLLELHERERRLISCEIHDGFAQQLTGALYRLQAFRETLARDPAEAWKSFDSAVVLLARAIDEARRLIGGLRPPVLDELGIVDAVQYLVYEHGKDGKPEIEYERDFPCRHLSPQLENAVFRIVQESLQNACRHSRSDKIRVSLFQRDDRIHIEVRDWGIGFNSDAVDEERFGLQGIRERVRLLDGRVTIDSAPTKGTRICVELPLVNDAPL